MVFPTVMTGIWLSKQGTSNPFSHKSLRASPAYGTGHRGARLRKSANTFLAALFN